MNKNLKFEGLGCNDILAEMERLQVLGGGIGGDGGINDPCTHTGCLYNTGCRNEGCGENVNCTNVRCHSFTECGVTPVDLYGEC